jgi:hypothetical protein
VVDGWWRVATQSLASLHLIPIITQDRLLLSCPLTYFTITYKDWRLGIDDRAIEPGIVTVTNP